MKFERKNMRNIRIFYHIGECRLPEPAGVHGEQCDCCEMDDGTTVMECEMIVV